MIRELSCSLVVLAMCTMVVSQQPAARGNGTSPNSGQTQTANAGPQTPRIAPGSVIPVELTKTIDAKKAKTGDPVEAKVTQDMKTGNGQVLLPKDTKVVGHVTEAQPRTKEQKESQLAIAFDHAVIKDGSDVSMPMSIQAIIAPTGANGGNANNAEGTGPSPSAPASGGVAPNTGSHAGMSGTSPAPSAGTQAGGAPNTSSQTAGASNPPITGKTEGVVGISNLKLSAATQPAQGSLLSSEKNNVKLESGTFMLLRVNP